MPSYTLHGLLLDSNVPIGGFSPASPDSGQPQAAVHFGALPPLFDAARPSTVCYESEDRDPAGQPHLRIRRFAANGDLWLRYLDGVQFVINAACDSVFAVWPEELTFEDAAIYFLGPVVGILLRARGWSCLHASVVAADGEAIGLCGPSGAGKSTIAAAFARAGHSVLSDDLLVPTRIGDRLYAEPGYSWVRLWPASVRGLYGSLDSLPLLVHGWTKRYLDLAADGSFCTVPLPLGAIYVIGDPHTDGASPTFEPLSRRAALMQLIVNSYAARVPGPVERRRDFETFNRMADELPVREMRFSRGWDSLATLPEVMLTDFAEARVTGGG